MTDDAEQQAELLARVHPAHWQHVSHVWNVLHDNTPTPPPDPAAIPCISQDPTEPAAHRYLDACTGTADLMATSIHCEGTGCGGHPICRPCYDLARAEGKVR